MLGVTMPIQKKVYFFWFYYTYYAGLLVKKGTCCMQNQIRNFYLLRNFTLLSKVTTQKLGNCQLRRIIYFNKYGSEPEFQQKRGVWTMKPYALACYTSPYLRVAFCIFYILFFAEAIFYCPTMNAIAQSPKLHQNNKL
jgi:hypothetical protein